MEIGNINTTTIAMIRKKIRAEVSARIFLAENDNLESFGSDQAATLLDDIDMLAEIDGTVDILGKAEKKTYTRLH